MEWNQHRLACLSGIEDRYSARDKLLKENKKASVRRSTSNKSSTSLNETSLRAALRKEIIAVLREELSNQEEKTMSKGIQRNSLTTSMGFGGSGFTPRNTSNKASARSGRAVAFGGPGFM